MKQWILLVALVAFASPAHAQLGGLLNKAQQAKDKFAQADEAQRQGDTVRWARLMEQGRRLVDQAVRQIG